MGNNDHFPILPSDSFTREMLMLFSFYKFVSSGNLSSSQYQLHLWLSIKLFIALIDKLPVQKKNSSFDLSSLEATSGSKSK